MGDREWRCAQVFRKKTSQMPAGYAESVRKIFNVALVQCATGYQSQTATDSRRRTAPCRSSWRRLGPAAQAGSESRLTRGCGTRKKTHIFTLWCIRRANRPAIYAGCSDTDIEVTIEARIPRQSCSFVNFVLQHRLISLSWRPVYAADNVKVARIGRL